MAGRPTSWRLGAAGAVMELLPGVLDSQLRRDAEPHALRVLRARDAVGGAGAHAADDRAGAQTNATLPRLSHVVRRLEERGLVERFPCPEDARATNARLTDAGWDKVRATAPGHVATVREHVIDALTAEQIDQLAAIADAILGRLDPERRVAEGAGR